MSGLYLDMLGGPSSINWAISYRADKDCRIENTGKETRKHSSSLLLLIAAVPAAVSRPAASLCIYFIFVQSSEHTWLPLLVLVPGPRPQNADI